MTWVAYAGLYRNVLKGTIPAVAEQIVGFTGVAAAGTLHGYTAKIAQLTIIFCEFVDIHVQISRHEQVNVAIAVVVSPGGSHTVSAESNAGLFSDVCELAVA
jgi:hypothetical protein